MVAPTLQEADALTSPESSEPIYVQVEKSRGFATVILDSPHNRNALSETLVSQLKNAMLEAAADTTIRAVILTHKDKIFCAGMDLSRAARAGTQSDDDSAVLLLAGLFRTIFELPIPVISVIDGAARGGGVAIAAASDITIAGPNAHFGMPEARLGLVPTTVSLAILPRVDNRAISRYYLTGETFDSTEAARIGLVTIATDDVETALAGIKDNVLKGSPQAHRGIKELINKPFLDGYDRLPYLADLSLKLVTSPEVREGITAFFQKRPPVWAVVSD